MSDTARLEYLEREDKFNKHIIARQNEEIERLTRKCKELKDVIHALKKQVKYLKNITAKRCGTCVYAKPAVLGNSKMHVECTNEDHLKRYCSTLENTKYRPRNTHACRHYVEKVGEQSYDTV